MCPCFDAEAEYAFLDDVKLGKYDDAGFNEGAEPAHPETYVIDHPRDYTGLFNEIAPAPWMK